MPYVYLYTNAEAKANEQVTSLKIVTITENDIELRTDDCIPEIIVAKSMLSHHYQDAIHHKRTNKQTTCNESRQDPQ